MAELIKLMVLIINDSPGDQRVISEFLKFDTCEEPPKFDVSEIICVSNAKEALFELSKDNFDLIISDIYLPDVNGLELCKNIRTLKIDTPIIVLSGYSRKEMEENALNSGANAYLPADKTEPEDLLRLIHCLCITKNLTE